MGAYSVNIVSLSNRVHHFEYEIGEKFFRQYGSNLLSEGSFQVNIVLDRHETFIESEFKIRGTARLVCDRSLEPFDYPIESDRKIVFKFGEKNEELSDEIIMIHREMAVLELGQYIYEFITLMVPMKKLHPRFQHEAEDEGSEGKIVYTSEDPDKANKEDEIDPRWNILKKLK